MVRKSFLSRQFLMILGITLVVFGGNALAQWPPSQPQPSPYPPQQPGYFPQQPPPQQPPYPPSQPGYLPQQPSFIQPPQIGGQMFSDAFGRFKVNLPQGTMPVGAAYNFGVPSAMSQISITFVGQDQMFQMQMQTLPNMLRQMGANVDPESQIDVSGHPARLISAAMRDPMSGMSMRSINVFIQGTNLWVQVMGPEQNLPQIQQLLQVILSSLQF